MRSRGYKGEAVCRERRALFMSRCIRQAAVRCFLGAPPTTHCSKQGLYRTQETREKTNPMTTHDRDPHHKGGIYVKLESL